ncbi:MAG: DUF1801 domain-containing protein [Thalassobaculaceae bacterium]
MTGPPFADPAVEQAFGGHPPAVRAALLDLRSLILETAQGLAEVGPVVETLKWGQPAYLPKRPKVGTTLRIDALKGRDDGIALFFHCQSRLGELYRERYGDTLTIVGDRSIELDADDALPREALKHCVALALTYHLRKRAG